MKLSPVSLLLHAAGFAAFGAVLAVASLSPATAAAAGETVRLLFSRDGEPCTVERQTAEILPLCRTYSSEPANRYEAIARALLVGPTAREKGENIVSAIPDGTLLGRIVVPTSTSIEIHLDLPDGYVGTDNYSPALVEDLGHQFIMSLVDEGLTSFRFFVKDPASGEYKPIRAFLPKPPVFGPEPDNALTDGTPSAPAKGPAVADPQLYAEMPTPNPGQVTGALSGKSVVLNLSHGWFWNNTYWSTQRPKLLEGCEDLHNCEFAGAFLIPMLLNCGARVQPSRETDFQTNMVIVDNADGAPAYVEDGTWLSSTANGFARGALPWSGMTANPFGTSSATRYASVVSGTPTATATYTPSIPAAGFYNVYISFSKGSNRTTAAHWQVRHTGGTAEFRVNERIDGATWLLLGKFHFAAGSNPATGSVVVLNDAPDGTIVTCDAVRFGGGMGDVNRRGGGVSGKLRWQEEACNYLTYLGCYVVGGPLYGDSSSSSDQTLGWTNRPQYASWEQARDSEGDNVVYLGIHTNASSGGCSGGQEVYGSGRGTSSYRDVDADATAGTIALANAVHNAVIDGARKLYNQPTWQNRNVIASNNYGECNQASLGTVSGFFFELLFHDNVADMAAYKDPKFRIILARAMTQGIIAYYGGTTFPPETPTNFRVRNVGGQARLDWTPGPVRDASHPYGSAATAYRVYRSTDGYGFDSGTDTANTNMTLDLPAGQPVFFRVAAVNSAGVSLPGETLAICLPVSGSTRVLIVNGYNRFDQYQPRLVPEVYYCVNNLVRKIDPYNFQTFNCTVQHAGAIAAAGVSFDSCADECVEQSQMSLGSYRAVDWIGGQEAEIDTIDNTDNTSVKPAARAAIQSYLEAGGRLYMNNAKLAWDCGSRGPDASRLAFLSNYMKAGYSATENATRQVQGSGGIFAGVGPFMLDDGTGNTYKVDGPGVLSTMGSLACMSFVGGSGGTAAVQYEGLFGGATCTYGRLVYTSFGFEAITSEATRNDVMKRILDWLGATVVEVDLAVAKTDSPDPVYVEQPLAYTVTVTNLSQPASVGVTVTDILPATVTMDAVTVSCGTVSESGGILTWEMPTLLGGATATMNVSVTPNEAGDIDNVASVLTEDLDTDPSNNVTTAATHVLPVADLTISKISEPFTAYAGQDLTYTIAATNNGPSAASGVVVTDALPAGVTFVSGTSSQGTTSESGGTVTANLGAIANGAGATITIVVRPQASTTLHNAASVTASEFDPATANNSASVDTIVLPAADLSITKTASPDPVPVDGDLTYTIVVTNNGPSETGATVTDTLPTGVTFVSATATQGSCSQAGGRVTCNLGDLANGAAATVTIVVRPQVTGSIRNAVQVDAGNHDPVGANNMAHVDSTVIPSADLVLTKTATPDPVPLGSDVTYTLVVTNGGPSPATGVTVTDTLPAGVTFVSAAATQGACSQAGGLVTCNLGDLAVGASVTVTIVARPQATGVIHNTAQVSGNDYDPDGANNTAQADITVAASADLAIAKSATPDPVPVGQQLTYTIGVINSGPSDATAVTVTDTLPAAVTFVSATSSQGSCAIAGGVLTCNLGTLANGASASITIEVTPQAEGTVRNTACVSGAEHDPASGNNTVVRDTQVVASADLALAKTASPEPTAVSQDLVYTLTLANGGPCAAHGVTVTDTLPPGVAFVAASSTQGTCTQSGNTVTCDAGSVPNNGSVTITITVAPTQPGAISNEATVTGDDFDPDQSNNSASADSTVITAADIAIEKTATPDSVAVGGTLTYTLTVTNHGPSDATGVVVTDNLPANVDYVSATATQGVCSVRGTVVTCAVGNMAPAAVVTVTIVTKVQVAGTMINTAAVSATETDLQPDNNTAAWQTACGASGIDLTGNWTGLVQTLRGLGQPKRASLRGEMMLSNTGTVSSPRGVMRLYLSSDPVLDPQDAVIARTVTVRPLSGGSTRRTPLNVQLPVGVSAIGSYVIAVLDPDNTIAENSERNNVVVFGPVI